MIAIYLQSISSLSLTLMHTDLPMNRSKNCLESKHPLKANKFFYFNLEQDLKPQQCIGTTTIEITNSIHQKPRKKKNQLWSHALALYPRKQLQCQFNINKRLLIYNLELIPFFLSDTVSHYIKKFHDSSITMEKGKKSIQSSYWAFSKHGNFHLINIFF